MKNVNCSKPGYTSITCSKISTIPYNLIFKTKFNDSSILIMIISWDDPPGEKLVILANMDLHCDVTHIFIGQQQIQLVP
jgi:hypothetical protein